MVALSAKMNKTTPHNNQIHFLVQEIPGQVGTKPRTEFDQTPSSRAVMQYIRAVNQGGWLARLPQRFQATGYWVPEDQETGVSV